MVSLFAYGNTVLALANKEVDNISEYILLQSPVFTTIKNNIENVILNYKTFISISHAFFPIMLFHMLLTPKHHHLHALL